ncbi:MAG: hypothetical protein QOG14_2663 [Mycobacterium sp.]|nr:hypothetical protein [Mycobacterium sp.]
MSPLPGSPTIRHYRFSGYGSVSPVSRSAPQRWDGVPRIGGGAACALAVLNCGVALNMSVGYFTTAQMAWNELTAGPLPDETDRAAVTAMSDDRAVPAHGTVVPVKIASDVSKFKHRTEFVYLPPAWYSTNPPPSLPAAMMIGGQLNTPADWIRQGNAADAGILTLDCDVLAADNNELRLAVYTARRRSETSDRLQQLEEALAQPRDSRQRPLQV